MSIRTRRLERLVREVLDEIIRFKIKNPPLPMLSITLVRMTADLRRAKIYISAVAGEADTVSAVKRLEKMKGYIRSLLGKEIRVRYTPEINFLADNSIAEGTRILELMRKIETDDQGRPSDSEQAGRDDLP